MTFLPIFNREVRARGHSPAIYWARSAAAAFGLLVCFPTIVLNGSPVGPGTAGRDAFISIVTAAFLVCCGACLLTCDAVSRERREGTLSLLLLTRVSHWDILLAKLGSTGLAAFVSLLAFVPVITLPLLGSGATAGEAWRVALVLANTLFLGLAVGLCASSFSVSRFRSAGIALALVVTILVAPFFFRTTIRLLSPFSGLVKLQEANYQASAAPFWRSLLLVHGMGWLLIATAVRAMRRFPNEVHIARARPANTEEEPTSGGGPVQCRYCGRVNGAKEVYCYECGTELHEVPVYVPSTWTLETAPSPPHWLLARQPGFQPLLWIAATITAFKFALLSVVARLFPLAVGPWFPLLQWTFGFLSAAASAALIAYTATRFIAEAQRSGSLEVLLTTPVRIGEWAAAQWDFLKRVMTLPLLLMLTPTLFQALFLLAEGRLRAGATAYGLLVLINAWQTVAGVAALCWLSLLLAFGGIGQGRTILWTILIAEGVPYAVTVMWGLFCHAVVAKLTGSANVWTSPGFWVGSLLPQLVTVMFYLWVIRVARSHLLHQNLRGELYDVGRLIRLSFAGVQAVPGHPGECRTG